MNTTLIKAELPNLVAKVKASTMPDEKKQAALDVLSMRVEVGKTSNAKYTAILNCVGKGNRIRGLFRYYCASRTGRWAGRLVQLQNLPQNHLEDLER